MSATHAATLRAIAAVVLPSALGRSGTDEVADRFVQWVRGYRPGTEMEHGYGFTRLRVTGPSPVDSYLADLNRLEQAASARGGTLGGLAPETRRELIERARM